MFKIWVPVDKCLYQETILDVWVVHPLSRTWHMYCLRRSLLYKVYVLVGMDPKNDPVSHLARAIYYSVEHHPPHTSSFAAQVGSGESASFPGCSLTYPKILACIALFRRLRCEIMFLIRLMMSRGAPSKCRFVGLSVALRSFDICMTW
jgi:hypothetical protein